MTNEAAAQERCVVIAVPTFRRARLLPALIAAIRADAATVQTPTRILVVDNDPDRSAEQVSATLGVAYLAQHVPGIAATRQAALDAAGIDDLVVMLDDDLVPEPGWLEGLVSTWEAHRPAVVMGYVHYVWPEGTDPWIAAGGFMRRTRFPTGTSLSALSTGSALFDVAQIRALGVAFDAELGLSGGDDLEFGRALLAAGGVIIASAESVARDDIVLERTSRAFVRKRAICQGQVRARLLSRDPLPSARFAKRAGHLTGGLLRVPAFATAEAWARVRGDVRRSAVYRRRLWFAQGRILGAVGSFTPEYARD